MGQQRMGEHGPQVSLLAKDLPSFTFVRETYLEHDGLPQLPWLTGRCEATPPGADRPAGAERP